MEWTSDVITLTSHQRHSLTSSPTRNSDVIRTGVDEHNITTVNGGISNNVVKTTSVLLPVSLTASGDHVTTSPDMTPSSTRSVVDETPLSMDSANYGSERVTVVIVICVCVLVLVVVIMVIIAVLVRYDDSFCHCLLRHIWTWPSLFHVAMPVDSHS